MRAPASSRQPPASNDETAPFLIGVLRRDGIVSPFAAFDGKDWDIPWPDDLRWKELPIGLESVPSQVVGKAGRAQADDRLDRRREPRPASAGPADDGAIDVRGRGLA